MQKSDNLDEPNQLQLNINKTKEVLEDLRRSQSPFHSFPSGGCRDHSGQQIPG